VLGKFFSGLAMGLGFSLSLIIVLTIWINYILPFSHTPEPMTIRYSNSETIPHDDKYTHIENFSDMPLEDKIFNSTAIIVTSIDKDNSGKYQSTVTEILKKEDDIDLHYKVGDIYEDYSNYNQYEAEGRFIPKGFIIFMGGDPASMMYSVSYSGERIGSLGGISIELLREKCK